MNIFRFRIKDWTPLTTVCFLAASVIGETTLANGVVTRVGDVRDVVDLTVFNDEIFFAGSGDAGFELYKTDGTNVTQIADINPNGDAFVKGRIHRGFDVVDFAEYRESLCFRGHRSRRPRVVNEWK